MLKQNLQPWPGIGTYLPSSICQLTATPERYSRVPARLICSLSFPVSNFFPRFISRPNQLGTYSSGSFRCKTCKLLFRNYYFIWKRGFYLYRTERAKFSLECVGWRGRVKLVPDRLNIATPPVSALRNINVQLLRIEARGEIFGYW